MKTRDVSDGGTRLDAALTALLEGLVAPQLAQGVGASDAVSMLVMGPETETQFSKLSFPDAKAHLEAARAGGIKPKGHGFYVPALKALGNLLRATRGTHPVNVMFLSDGRPSDQAGRGPGTIEDKVGAEIQRALAEHVVQRQQAVRGGGEYALYAAALHDGAIDSAPSQTLLIGRVHDGVAVELHHRPPGHRACNIHGSNLKLDQH